ncbi:MAG: DUF935 domain-containing protein [Magnetococcus sp. THC-1_WYH]
MRTLAWPFIYKHYAVADFAEFLEIFGLPLRLGKYPSEATQEEKAALTRAVREIGHAAAGIIPEQMTIEFEESARIGSNNMFMSMIEWAEQSISKAVLGGTLTSQADGKTSTNALGNVHNDVRRDLLESDARQIASTLTRGLVWPLTTLNTAITDPQRTPVFRFDTRQPDDLKKFADALPPLVAVGTQIPVRWVYESLGIPEPKEGEPVLGTNNNRSPGTALSKAALSGTFNPPVPDLSDRYVARGMELAGPAIKTMLNPIRNLLARANSLEEFRDSLFAVYPDMDSTALTTILAQTMIAANLGGRAEVIDGE